MKDEFIIVLAITKTDTVRQKRQYFKYTYVNVCDWKIDVVQKFIMVFHRVTGWKEHHHFLVSVLFQEREQHEKTLLWRNNYISLYMVKNIYVNWDILSKSQDRYILAQQAG